MASRKCETCKSKFAEPCSFRILANTRGLSPMISNKECPSCFFKARGLEKMMGQIETMQFASLPTAKCQGCPSFVKCSTVEIGLF
jgi:hypothetical protein